MAEKGLSRVSRLTRGAVSKRTGMNIETIRYDERAGLMPEPPRSQGGHRLYDEKHLKRLTFGVGSWDSPWKRCAVSCGWWTAAITAAARSRP